VSISTDLVCLPSPWVPHQWLPPQHRIEVNRNRYLGTGDLPDPKGSDICLDSAWQLLLIYERENKPCFSLELSHIQFIYYSLHIVDLFHISCHDISIEITSVA
jgi:hypothetical protein